MLSGNSVMNGFGFGVRNMRLFWGIENTQINIGAFDANRRLPLRAFFIPAYAFKTASIIFADLFVVQILLLCHYAQIAQTIVRTLAIYVVNLTIWKFAMNNCPNNSMRFIHFLFVAKLYIAVGIQTFGRSARTFAYKISAIRIVSKRFAQLGNVNVVHGLF